MLIAAQKNLPLCLHTHIFDKTTNRDISNINDNKQAYAFKEWDTVTKWGLVVKLDKTGIPIMNKERDEALTEWRHFPNAETVFIIPNKNMIELVAIRLLMLEMNVNNDLLKSRGFDLLSIMVAEAMSEPDVSDISFRSSTDYDKEADDKRKREGKELRDYIEII